MEYIGILTDVLAVIADIILIAVILRRWKNDEN